MRGYLYTFYSGEVLSYKKPKGLPLTAGEKVTFPLNPKRTAYSSVTNVSTV